MSPASGPPHGSAARGYLKRGSDLAIGTVLLLVSAPLILMSAAVIRLDSPGPVLFRQVRIGRGRQPFTLLKLRTMQDGAHLGADITVSRDSRVTRVGRFLRRSRIDELPQLWNVLRGEMSLVGPRPEQPRIVANYPSSWNRLLEVRPGLTDEATLAFRDEAALLRAEPETTYEDVILPAKARVSLEGMRAQSLASDLSLLARTAGVVTGLLRPREHPEVARIRDHLARQRLADT